MDVNSAAARAEGEAGSDRRARILDAAERCFVRSGFHRTTMQDVAAEAGMSPGNLYRYFPSKDAMVAGLAERDRAQIARDFATVEGAQDFMAALGHLARKHFEDEPRDKAVVCLEIWAEATHNPAFAQLTQDFDRDIVGHLVALIRQAQAQGAILPTVDPCAVAGLLSILADGLFVRRAITPQFDSKGCVRLLTAVIEAACAGRIDLSGSGLEAASDAAPGRTSS